MSMTPPSTAGTSADTAPRHASWSAVLSMALCAGVLISSEFLPVSLLTPIASDLHITEGHAGQSISISGLFAMITSLLISPIIGSHDRKRVLLFFTGLMIISGCIVTFAPNAAILMAGRAFLGVAIGGFWSISAATMMRLVPKESLPKALSILNGGNALASTFAAPLGSFLGQYIGWRGSFFVLVPLAMIAFLWQWRRVPALPAEHLRRPVTEVLKLLSERIVFFGMASCALMFLGQFALFTYLRPFLETVTRVTPNMLTMMLLGIGISGFIGTYLISLLLKNRLYSLLIPVPSIMGVIGIGLITLGASNVATGALLLLWGLFATSIPVAWWAWLSKTLAHDAEAGGGLMVAIVQMAIMTGAGLGGYLYDHGGYQHTFWFAVAMLLSSSVFAALTLYESQRTRLTALLA